VVVVATIIVITSSGSLSFALGVPVGGPGGRRWNGQSVTRGFDLGEKFKLTGSYRPGLGFLGGL
jgi:hypothetical protein